LQNAIRNLIDNALKYAPNESKIYISVKSKPTPFVEICDQGPGFPAEEIENLTTRFARGSNADGIVGSGLGLTIAKDVAVAHDGELLLSNHEKGGACAILSLS
jgi:two-component system sensor histidine kinase TctE